MNRWNGFLAIALGTMLAVPDASAAEAPSGIPRPHGEMRELDSARTAAPDYEALPSEIAEAQTVEGEVAIVNRETGAFVLDTDEGLIGLVTSPDEVADLEVGDWVRVSFVDNERD